MWNSKLNNALGNISNLTNAVISNANGNPVAAVTSAVNEADAAPTAAVLSLIRGKPVRLSGIIWKRRSGLGKYSTSAAWERRRFELIGNILCYYGKGSENDADNSTSTSISNDTITKTSGHNSNNDLVEKSTSNDHSSGEGQMEIPRGYLDLLKDDASVGASTGHSAAPTPFAISIKVLGQTKWKMCFDTHTALMQWLAALTDVIVQGSVDGYNVQLLQAADPTSGGDFAGQLREPPREDESEEFGVTGGHRLWTTGQYKVQNCNGEELAELERTMKLQEDELRRQRQEQQRKRQEEIDNLKKQQEKEKQEEIERKKKEAEELEQKKKMEELQKQEELEKQKAADALKAAAAVGDADAAAGAAKTIPEGKDEPTKEEPKATAAPKEVPVETTRSTRDAELKLNLGPLKVFYGFPTNYLPVAAMVLNASLFMARSSFTSIEVFWALTATTNVAFIKMLQKITTGGVASSSSIEARKSVSVARKAPITRNITGAKSVSSQPGNDAARAVGEAEIAVDDFKPHAGATMLETNDTSSPPTKDGQVFIGWRAPPPESIMLRSHGYSKTKRKVPSPGELYKCIRADYLASSQRCPDMASRVILPKVDFKDDGPKTWNAPDIFVVTISIPTDAPSFATTATDGGGFSIVMYFVMCDDTREILRRVTAEGYDPSQYVPDDIQKSKVNAARLFDDWCRRAPNDDSYMARFKVVPDAQNLDAIGVPSWISKYNAKPFLIKRPGQTGFLFRHPEQSCMEFDISLHPFPFIAKKGICFMKDSYFKSVIVTFAFVIESRSDDELPECLLGLMTLCYPDPEHAIQADDYFAGKLKVEGESPYGSVQAQQAVSVDDSA